MKAVFGVVVDGAIMMIAFAAAIALRFDFQAPRWGMGGDLAVVSDRRVRAAGDDDRLRLPAPVEAQGAGPDAVHAGVRQCRGDHDALPHRLSQRGAGAYSSAVHGQPHQWRPLGRGRIGHPLALDAFANARNREAKLLNRKERVLADASVRACFAGKCVMVTGAGGSIGSEIVRQVLDAGAAKVLMVERGENALYDELKTKGSLK